MAITNDINDKIETIVAYLSKDDGNAISKAIKLIATTRNITVYFILNPPNSKIKYITSV